jgi:hypothetical protein
MSERMDHVEDDRHRAAKALWRARALGLVDNGGLGPIFLGRNAVATRRLAAVVLVPAQGPARMEAAARHAA